MNYLTTAPTISEAEAREAFTRLCTAAFLAYSSYAICRVPLLPFLAQELGADPPMVGLVMGASTLTGVLVKLPAGALSDVLGRRPLLVLGMCVFALLPFGYRGVSSLVLLIALRFLHGSATAIVGPVAAASLSDIAPVERRGTWLSTYSTIQGTGQAVGPIVAGYLLASGRYDLAFMIAGMLAAATPLIVARWPAETRQSTSGKRARTILRGVLEVCGHRLILVTSAAQAALFVLNGTLNAFLPLFAHQSIGLTASALGWLFGLQTITTLAVRPLMGRLSDRVGRRDLIVAGLIICGGAVLLLASASGPARVVVAVMAYAAGVAITTAASGAFITDLSRRSRYGAAHGVFGTIYDIGDALGPIAGGTLVARMGYASMFRMVAAVPLSVAIAFYLMTRAMRGPGPR